MTFFNNPGSAYDVEIDGDFAFIANGDDGGVSVIDISDPENPDSVSFIDIPGFIMDVCVSNDYAYVAAQQSGLRIVDVSNPENPEEISLLNLRIMFWV